MKKRLVPDAYFSLSPSEQGDVLDLGRERTGRPAHLLEKDIWVVWTLNALFQSPAGCDLTFKGGTSLSKAYRLIDRFSEDLDLTYDIRKLIGDLTGTDAVIPTSRSQAGKWTRAVRDRLPDWIRDEVQTAVQDALDKSGLTATLELSGTELDKLLLHYPAVKRGTGYVAPVVTLEFGGRATGEPHAAMPVVCDLAAHVEGVMFPTATPVVMGIARTFWEKATAAHVYCAQGRIRSERYARHWHDLAAIMRSPHFDSIVQDRAVAKAVAQHKAHFFIEKDADGHTVDYAAAVTGSLQLVPTDAAREALAEDYSRMLEDQLIVGDALPFDVLMQSCTELTARANAAARG